MASQKLLLRVCLLALLAFFAARNQVTIKNFAKSTANDVFATLTAKSIKNLSSTQQQTRVDLPHGRDVLLQNQIIGAISPICKRNDSDCDIIKATNDDCPNINGPVVIHRNSTYFLFVGMHTLKHTLKQESVPIRLFQSSALQDGPWQENKELTIPLQYSNCARGLYSPDIFEYHGRYYMHAHVHACKDITHKKGRPKPQPTIALVSDDLVHWELPRPTSKKSTYVSKDMFYSKLFVYKNTIYAIAKSQEDATGSMTLLKSDTPLGPYQRVCTLAKGTRHVSLHLKGDMLYVFFTVIGDEPERILLGTIDLSRDKKQLLPGPIILTPPNADGKLRPSRYGSAPCEPVQELRDPLFIPDDDESEAELKGTLFYTLRGEQAIGASKMYINLTAYHEATTVKFRNHDHIDSLIYQSSSLAKQLNALDRSLLITGVGRSGTAFICTYLNRFGWNISHDNNKNCGPFGGKFGASSWYHAFRLTRGIGGVKRMRVKKVVHLIRDPLKVVKSRLGLSGEKAYKLKFIQRRIKEWENINFMADSERNLDLFDTATYNSTMYASFILRHWINRNSFVSQYAEWRISIENITEDPLETWMLCLEGGRDDCPYLEKIRTVLNSMDTTINHKGTVEHYDQDDMIWWDQLAAVNEADVRIALKMAEEYGYSVDDHLKSRFQIARVKYECNFGNEMAARSQKEKPREWGCAILNLD